MRKVFPQFDETAIVPDAKLNIGQGSFRDSLLFRWQLSDGAKAGTSDEKLLSRIQVFGIRGKGESS